MVTDNGYLHWLCLLDMMLLSGVAFLSGKREVIRCRGSGWFSS